MPGHLSAADAPEDLWRCHDCGWTYPNHHPSAKHRKNHKKQCGKLPGFVKTTDLTSSSPHRATGSSDDCSSDEEHHREHHLSSNQVHEKNSANNGRHLQELLQSPSPEAATNLEQVSCNGSSNGSGPTPSDDGGAQDTLTIHEETALSTRNLDLPASKEVAETPNGIDHGRSSSRGSAHALRGQWCCKHCGWAYSNPHPSAKIRRKHKRSCGVAAAHVGAGGSSDEASSDDGSESKERVGTQELLKSDSSLSQGSPGAEIATEINAKDTDLSKDVDGQALADTAQEVPFEANSSSPQVPHGATGMDGINEGQGQEIVNVDDSQVAMVDEERTGLTFEKAPGAPIGSDVHGSGIPVPLIDDLNSSQSQVPGEIPGETRDGTISKEQNLGELDGIRDTDLSKDVDGQALADTAQEVPFESNSSSPQVPHGATGMDGINEGQGQEKVNVDDSQVAMVDEERTGLIFEKAPGAPNGSDVHGSGIPVPLIDDLNSSQSQVPGEIPGEIRDGTTSKEQNLGELDGIIPDQQQVHVTTEQVEDRKQHLPQLSRPILRRENVGKTTNNQEERDLTSTMSQSPVTLGANSARDTMGGPKLDTRNSQPKSATRAGDREDSVSKFEERSAPESRSPEGLVRSRVQIFEKLAQTSPQYLWKPVSPTTNSASPRQPRKNGITDAKVAGADLHETPKVFQETIPHHRQSSETRPASKFDTPNELQKVFSHLRHRGNFVQIECNPGVQ